MAFAPENCPAVENTYKSNAVWSNDTEREQWKELYENLGIEKDDDDDVYARDETMNIGMEGIKDGQPHSLITLEHVAEMIRFENWLFYELEIPVPRPNATMPHRSYDSMCKKTLNYT